MKMKRLLAGITLIGLIVVCPIRHLQAQNKETATLKELMKRIELQEGVSFIYESSLRVNVPYNGKTMDTLPLKESLENLFKDTGVSWKMKGNYIILNETKKHFTLNGYVYQKNGESLINATLIDRESGKGTLTNTYGYYSFTLPQGEHSIRFSYVGFKDTVLTVYLDQNLTQNIYLPDLPPLQEVVVESDLNSPIHTTQTGKTTLSKQDLNTEFAVLSSPDLVKSLQMLPGVTSGTELISGLYVHGGNNDGNLFLLDGNPLYQVNHLGGIFSAFNTDIIKTVDFYKSGFPARYGGRLSSIVDVRTNDGDMQAFHGTFSIGLLDGRVQLEGPIVKNKTSFNIAMRRSWADLFTATAFGLRNLSKKHDHLNGRYSFQDINAKVTHRFSNQSRLYLSFYSGNDYMKIRNKSSEEKSIRDEKEEKDQKFKLKWGNITTSLNWNYVFSPKLFSNLTAVYSKNKSNYIYYKDYRLYDENGREKEVNHTKASIYSSINDIGYRMEFDYHPSTLHRIRFGSNYLHHSFRPQNNFTNDITGTKDDRPDTLTQNTSRSYNGNEVTVYAEDDITLLPNMKVNLGVHYTLFNIQNKNYHSIEPRVAVQIGVSKDMSIKFSYVEMSQFVHQLSNTYLNLPTDYWVPTTPKIRPMRSRQLAAGFYAHPTRQLRFAVEGFYKTMSRLIEYNGGNSLTPSIDNWEDLVLTGKGRAYGAEFSFAYTDKKTSAELAYTLSWSERKFPNLNRDNWYPANFDNRHKLNITARHKFTPKIELYAGWTFHTGYRATVATQKVEKPVVLPGGGIRPDLEWVYEKPNNLILPPYHRLDVGINFRRITKRGFERTWNVSIYNTYCRMNPLYAEIIRNGETGFIGKATGVFPIIPSFSYTLKF